MVDSKENDKFDLGVKGLNNWTQDFKYLHAASKTLQIVMIMHHTNKFMTGFKFFCLASSVLIRIYCSLPSLRSQGETEPLLFPLELQTRNCFDK